MSMHATFVLPAPRGCNMACPYCAIAQRKEAETAWLTFEDYIRFLSGILAHLKVSRVSIQGFEPLLPEAWPTTRRLLKLASAFFCQTGLVTNGTYLAQHAVELAQVAGSVAVSLDSAMASVHDKLRQVNGAFASALEGIRAARACFPKGAVTVNSVLLPQKAEYLSGMPELLAGLGVTEWIISPMLSFSKGGYLPKLGFIKETILRFSAEAQTLGIEVLLSDELRTTAETDLFELLSVRSLGVEDEIFRLSPDGSCSRGREVLGISSDSPKWDKVEAPNVFLARIFGDIGSPLRKRTAWGQRIGRWNAGRVAQLET